MCLAAERRPENAGGTAVMGAGGYLPQRRKGGRGSSRGGVGGGVRVGVGVKGAGGGGGWKWGPRWYIDADGIE